MSSSPSSTTLGFDVYGTLIDTNGIVTKLQTLLNPSSSHTPLQFTQTMRDKQLEYTFRRGLMSNYVPFDVVTRHALDYTCLLYNEDFTAEERDEILEVYTRLPAFNDVKEGLTQLKDAGYKLYAFSNGSADAVEKLLVAAGIRELFISVISCEPLKSYKPNPAVYAHFLRETKACGSEAWLISGNPFDVIGAISVGMKGVWLRRNKNAVFDTWEIQPNVAVGNLKEIQGKI